MENCLPFSGKAKSTCANLRIAAKVVGYTSTFFFVLFFFFFACFFFFVCFCFFVLFFCFVFFCFLFFGHFYTEELLLHLLSQIISCLFPWKK